jgi:hypothetical protein
VNRRGFISLMGGLAAAPLVPWRLEVTRSIILPPRFVLVPISGMRVRELGVPFDWLEGPWLINLDYGHIRSDRLELLEVAYRGRVHFVAARSGKSIVVPL